MNIRLFQTAWKEIVRRKKRSFAAIGGYFVIVAFVVLLINLLFTASAAKREFLNNLGTHFLVYFPEKSQDQGKEATNTRLADADGEAFFSDPAVVRPFPISYVTDIGSSRHVKAASPFLLFRMKSPETKELFCVGGFDPGNPAAVNGSSLQKSDVISGDFLLPEDRGLALLEEGYAVYKKLVVGSSVEIAGQAFTVKGIVRPGIRPAKADIYLAFEDAEKVVNTRLKTPLAQEANVALVEVASASDQTVAMAEVKLKYPDSMIDTYDCFNPASRTSCIDENSILLALGVLCVILFLFAGKIQATIIIEKRHDIGILSAIGWSHQLIRRHLLVQSAIQAVLGGVLGCVFGVVLTMLIARQAFLGTPIVIEPLSSATGLLLAIVGGLVTALIVIRTMISASPAQNLRRI